MCCSLPCRTRCSVLPRRLPCLWVTISPAAHLCWVGLYCPRRTARWPRLLIGWAEPLPYCAGGAEAVH